MRERWQPFFFRFGANFLLASHKEDLLMTDRNEEQAFNSEIPDELLERVGANEIVGQYTLAACTGLSVCPG
jgi:hypothetical protein